MYILTSSNIKNGMVGDDSANGAEYFELGWELVLTRLCLISGIKSGLFQPENDTIVTADGRQFLYSAFCKNVITYQDFLNLNVNEKNIFNLVSDVGNWVVLNNIGNTSNKLWTTESTLPNSKFLYTKETAPDICNFDTIDTNLIVKDQKDFCCLVVRKRDHIPSRGLTDHQLHDCFTRLKNKNYTIYIMGKGAEHYQDDRIHHVSLQDMTSLINSPKCKALITPLSGGGMIRLFTGTCPMITFDMHAHYSADHPLLWGESVNFSGLNSNNWKIVRGYNPNIIERI